MTKPETYPRFHLAIPVTDIDAARQFYGEVLGCNEGRSDERWVDFEFFGHQLVVHLVSPQHHPAAATSSVDGHGVPTSHFGPILSWEAFDELEETLRSADIEFVIEPYLRFEGLAGEQRTLFVKDPSGNHLEFKAFRDDSMVFATDPERQIAP